MPLLALLLACRPVDDAGLSEPVRAAWLEEVRFASLVLVGGAWGGSATMALEAAADGRVTKVPVTVRGGKLGLAVELIPVSSGAGTMRFRLPDRETTGDELLGHYSGNGESLTVLVGMGGHHLRNEHGVRLDAAVVNAFVGMFVGGEWATIDVDDEALAGDTGDTGLAP